MPQSLARIVVHWVFSTKQRRPWLTEQVRERLYAYMASVYGRLECHALLIGGTNDHVHVLSVLSRNHAPKKVIEEVKTASSKWMKTAGPEFAHFQWQGGYGVFSVSESNVEAVRKYIAGQEEHHREMTFQEELRKLLQRHGVEFDERYLWD